MTLRDMKYKREKEIKKKKRKEKGHISLWTHIGGNSSTVFDCVALHGDVVDLAVCVGEYKVLPG